MQITVSEAGAISVPGTNSPREPKTRCLADGRLPRALSALRRLTNPHARALGPPPLQQLRGLALFADTRVLRCGVRALRGQTHVRPSVNFVALVAVSHMWTLRLSYVDNHNILFRCSPGSTYHHSGNWEDNRDQFNFSSDGTTNDKPKYTSSRPKASGQSIGAPGSSFVTAASSSSLAGVTDGVLTKVKATH